MNKILMAVFASLILLVVGSYFYFNYLQVNESPLEITCDRTYYILDNEMLIECNVPQEIQTIYNDFLVTLVLVDDEDNIVFTEVLEYGENIILLDDLEYHKGYTLTVDGYHSMELELIEENFYTLTFSTIYGDFILPIVTASLVEVSDLSATLSINLVDTSSSVISIEVVVMEGTNEVATLSLDDLEELDVTITELSQETNYEIFVSALLDVSGCQICSTVSQVVEVKTLKTPQTPYAVISNVKHNDNEFEFDLITSNQEASNTTYLVELIDEEDNVVESFAPMTSDITIDISSIEEDVTLFVKANYSFLGVDYVDEVLSTYVIYANQYALYYSVPTLHLVDTSVPLTSYDDYDDYLFTFYNAGETEFTITCSIFIDCRVLRNNPLYSDIAFEIEGFIHPFYAPRAISYLTNENLMHISMERGYSVSDILYVNQEIEVILNSIIDIGMTDEQKVKAVHDYVVTHSFYDTQCYDNSSACDNDHSALGVLLDGNAVCEGYSHAVDVMLRALRIPTFRVSSDSHQWNAVLVDDVWYHLDATWDDPVGEIFVNYISYDYYLIDKTTLQTLDETEWHDYLLKYLYFID